MNHTELSFTEALLPGDEAGLVPGLPSEAGRRLTRRRARPPAGTGAVFLQLQRQGRNFPRPFSVQLDFLFFSWL